MSLMTLPDVVRCYRTSRALQRYLDGEADDRTATRIAEHLEECRRCGLNAATYRAIKQVIHAGATTSTNSPCDGSGRSTSPWPRSRVDQIQSETGCGSYARVPDRAA